MMIDLKGTSVKIHSLLAIRTKPPKTPKNPKTRKTRISALKPLYPPKTLDTHLLGLFHPYLLLVFLAQPHPTKERSNENETSPQSHPHHTIYLVRGIQ
jgi:hypothetical protein